MSVITLPTAEHSEVVARLRSAAERFRRSARVQSTLTSLVPNTGDGDRLRAQTRELERRFNQVVTLHGAALDEAARSLENEVTALEKAVETFDDGVSVTYFQQNFERVNPSAIALVDWAQLLGRYLGESPTRIDRLQFLLTRLVSAYGGNAGGGDRVELLAGLLPPVQIDSATQASAVAFFGAASKRLETFTSLDELIGSNFLLDLCGYKVTLRKQLLDPTVMGALIELEQALTACLGRLTGLQPQGDEKLAAHLALIDKHLEEMFSRLRTTAAAPRRSLVKWLNDKRKKLAAPKADTIPAFGKGAAPAKPPTARLVVMALVVAALAVVFVYRFQGSSLRPLEVSEVRALSRILVRGAVSPPVFIGQADKSRWNSLSADQRKQQAEAFAKAIAGRGWSSGTVLMDERVIVQVEGGDVLLVQ